MVVAPGVPAGVTAHKLLTQRVVLSICVSQLDRDHRLVLLPWDSARGGQEEQERGGHCGSLKANLEKRAGDTLRAGTPNTASQSPYRQAREKGSGSTAGAGIRGQRPCRVANGCKGREEEGREPKQSFPSEFPFFFSLASSHIQSHLDINLQHLHSIHIC